MSTEEEVNKQKELNEGKSFQKSLEQDLLELIQRRMGISSDVLNEQQDIANALKDQLKQVKLERSEKDLILRITNKLNSLTAKNYALLEDEVGTTKTLKSIKKDQESIDKNILLLLNQKKKIQNDTTKKSKEEQGFANDLVENLQAQIEKARDFKGELKQSADLSALIANDLAVKTIDAIKDIAIAIPGLRKFAAPFEIAAAAAKLQALENERLHGSTKGISKEKFKQIQAALEQRKLLTDQLKTGKGLDKQRVKALIEQGILEEKQFKIKENHYVTGNAASAKAMKLGIIDSLKPLEQIPKVVSPLEAGFKALGPVLKKALGPLALLAMLVQTLLEADKAAADLAKNMNMTYHEANDTRFQLTKMAIASGEVFVNTKGLQESLLFINNQLGTNVMLSGELLTQFTSLREASGLTNEELYGATQLQLTSNKTLNEITGEIMAQAKLTAKNNGVILNEKQILKEIKDVSAATTLSLGKNPLAISDAVTQAKALGMTLGQVEKIAEGLLNFESSITSELKAELLLGRDINLEQARLFALNNKIAGVAKEISKEIGSSADFARMNVLQQKALAEAVGMNREELAKTLFIQENIKATSEDGIAQEKFLLKQLTDKYGIEEARRRLGKESIEDLKNQAGIQDRFNKSVEKLKEIFVGMASPILQIVSPLVDVLVPALNVMLFLLTPILEIFKGIAGILTGNVESLSTMQTILGTIAIAAGVYYGIMGMIATRKANMLIMDAAMLYLQESQKRGIISMAGALVIELGIRLGILGAALATNAAITFGVGLAVVIAASAAAFAGIKAMVADDMVSGAPGYGKRALYDEGELTLLNDKDTVLAGTDLFKSPVSQPVVEDDTIAGTESFKSPVSQPIIENNTSETIIEKQSPLQPIQPQPSPIIENNNTETIIEKQSPLQPIQPQPSPIIENNTSTPNWIEELEKKIIENQSPIQPIKPQPSPIIENNTETISIEKQSPLQPILPNPSPVVENNNTETIIENNNSLEPIKPISSPVIEINNPLEDVMNTVNGIIGSNNIEDSLITSTTSPIKGIADKEPNIVPQPEIIKENTIQPVINETTNNIESNIKPTSLQSNTQDKGLLNKIAEMASSISRLNQSQEKNNILAEKNISVNKANKPVEDAFAPLYS